MQFIDKNIQTCYELLPENDQVHIQECLCCNAFFPKFCEFNLYINGISVDLCVKTFLTLDELTRIQESKQVDTKITQAIKLLIPRKMLSGYQIWLKTHNMKSKTWSLLSKAEKQVYKCKSHDIKAANKQIIARLNIRLKQMYNSFRRQKKRSLPKKLQAHISTYKDNKDVPYKQYLKKMKR